jgi:hypothetical protein
VGSLIALLLVAFPGEQVNANDVLRTLLGKSDLVVTGVVSSEVVELVSPDPVVNHLFSFTVTDVLKGDAKVNDSLKVCVARLQMEKDDRLPYLRKGARLILFLKSGGPRAPWVSADRWFAVQPYYSVMDAALKELAKEGRR